jgi:chromosomal replication initiator protein
MAVLEQALNTAGLWQAARLMLQTQMTGPSFDTWVSPLQCVSIENGALTLLANSQFQKDWVLKHYKSKVLGVMEAVLLESAPDVAPPTQLLVDVAAVVESDSPETDAMALLANESLPDRPWTPQAVNSQLNPRYTFDQFVVGSQNRLCHAVAVAISEAPATQYNPFFLYGPAGLGKTHLMHAVGHSIHYRYPGLVVRYITTEQFTNELIQALATKRMNQFREKYRRMDVLLLDDVQFLEGKERTQEEIFHTFNTLHQAGKQIVLTSDRPAGKLQGLEERLRSRFEWGLMTDITPPDLETRVAILQKKAERDGLLRQVTLTTDMLTLIAECHPANVRELEGALNKVVATALLEGGQWDMTRLQKLLGTAVGRASIGADTIIDLVSKYFHVKVPDLKGPGRSKDLSYARQIAVYLVRTTLDLSLPKLGDLFGGRNHTSIMYALEKVREEREHNAILDQQIKDIQARLQQLR